MCGRYVLHSPPTRIGAQFGVDAAGLPWAPRYNLAPLQLAPVVRAGESGRTLDLMRWGLVPSWAGDPALGSRLINARAETVSVKPAFRAAYRARRCVVPADGFYEWRLDASGKQPFFIHRRDGALLAMAGLWEHWAPRGGPELLTFTLLTTEASAWMRRLHERMPVLLDPAGVEQWLSPDAAPARLDALLHPLPDGDLDADAVSRAVGNTRNDTPELLAPVAVPEPGVDGE